MNRPIESNIGNLSQKGLSSLVKFEGRLLVRFKKKSILDGDFEFLHPDPQLDQNLKPTRNLCGQLLYIYLCIYVFSV